MSQKKEEDEQEEGVEVPYERIHPETLKKMVQEFVTRDGADWGDAGCSLAEKVEEVLEQLKSRRVRVVLDLKSQTANFIPCRQA
ncbi:hypothetical protein DSOUD_0816 [Desulfuromonas soudanensis]|uniref:YheU family protein n=1 Tax=Desulfuromonas soudanensis TaxID=1603606 RepID=A0A0M3QF78_9BACT|nr:YheU family protein [Desulfuromonas soudanensis]ALC15603.1 hypothetical protein DSOUD_0816 [Desulfuromonas soudanensis]